jgi:hypothetical protein
MILEVHQKFVLPLILEELTYWSLYVMQNLVEYEAVVVVCQVVKMISYVSNLDCWNVA